MATRNNARRHFPSFWHRFLAALGNNNAEYILRNLKKPKHCPNELHLSRNHRFLEEEPQSSIQLSLREYVFPVLGAPETRKYVHKKQFPHPAPKGGMVSVGIVIGTPPSTRQSVRLQPHLGSKPNTAPSELSHPRFIPDRRGRVLSRLYFGSVCEAVRTLAHNLFFKKQKIRRAYTGPRPRAAFV